ncbi:ABC transporter permease [Pseudobutyrivibrio ruminis]|uniref:ABC transporter permease n=1 Tax=Pseudobutyrivibrio ruminis TaxID=46206 RepID=UPI000691E037|nr:ABC transporter permease [Pseudobutyrivibrio ruminis]
MGKNIGIFRILKRVLIIVFLASVVVFAIYPIRNQDVTIVVDTNDYFYEKTYSYDELLSNSELIFEINNIQDKNIREIRFHRYFRSIAVDKIVAANIPQYAEIREDHILFNSATVEKMLSLSKSALLERLVFTLVALCVTLLLWIIINAADEKLDPSNNDNHGPINEVGRFFSDLKKYKQYMIFAAKADLNAEVANSYLNRLWWILEPFFNMLVYVIVFGKVMGNSIQNYATFTFSALLMWKYFDHIINYSVKCVRANRDIVTKIYVPKYVLLLTNMVLNFIKLLFSVAVLVIMLGIFKVHIRISIIYVIPAYTLMILFAFGAGMILLHYGVFIDDLSYAVGILLQMAMFLTGIFFDVVTALPTPLNGVMLCINPCTVFIDSMRNALLYGVIANVPLIIIWIILSMLISYIGIHIVFKNENGYVKVI